MLSKSAFIYTLSIFYVVLGLFMGFYGELNEDSTIESSDLTDNDSFGFFPNIIVGFGLMPLWLNTLLFSPLLITISFVIITTIFGVIFDGGA